MFRISVLMLTTLLCIASLSCQPFSTGYRRGVADSEEGSAMLDLRSIAAAQQAYSISNNGGFGTFQQLSVAGHLDSRFNTRFPSLNHYIFSMKVRPKSAAQAEAFFSCNADPIEGAQTSKHFYIDSTSSALHVNPREAATAKDPIVQP